MPVNFAHTNATIPMVQAIPGLTYNPLLSPLPKQSWLFALIRVQTTKTWIILNSTFGMAPEYPGNGTWTGHQTIDRPWSVEFDFGFGPLFNPSVIPPIQPDIPGLRFLNLVKAREPSFLASPPRASVYDATVEPPPIPSKGWSYTAKPIPPAESFYLDTEDNAAPVAYDPTTSPPTVANRAWAYYPRWITAPERAFIDTTDVIIPAYDPTGEPPPAINKGWAYYPRLIPAPQPVYIDTVDNTVAPPYDPTIAAPPIQFYQLVRPVRVFSENWINRFSTPVDIAYNPTQTPPSVVSAVFDFYTKPEFSPLQSYQAIPLELPPPYVVQSEIQLSKLVSLKSTVLSTLLQELPVLPGSSPRAMPLVVRFQPKSISGLNITAILVPPFDPVLLPKPASLYRYYFPKLIQGRVLLVPSQIPNPPVSQIPDFPGGVAAITGFVEMPSGLLVPIETDAGGIYQP